MTISPEKRESVARHYADYFEHLHSETIAEVHPLISDDIHFVDPFNDVKGRKHLVRVIEKMFEDVEDPQFRILDLAFTDTVCLMRWDFSCKAPVIGQWTVRGITELQFDADGLICAHYDYWDASRHFYRKLPFVGWMIRQISKKASI
ncbi:nuclear transport factor 2 family protein [uncultured Cohaesibacter sp.]|uniref:nuclear transport factor 2 family protein n=1 Tax=uncultured Cohaesibacter sp. TaxID=1002546 RepID=UPI00293154A6|nr:nuclear transport factor 2 family protein [uncultured Cohaesibacter sp.]